MEKGDGGSSRQRRRNQRIEKEVQKVLSRQQQKQQDLPAPALKHPGKLILLWRSTPVWGALGVLAGALLSQVSVNILFIFVWIVVCAEFVSLRISEKKPIRYLVNIAFTVLLAAMFIVVWHVTPRAKVPPTIDQEMDAFAKRFPELLRSHQDRIPVQSTSTAQASAVTGTLKPRAQRHTLTPLDFSKFEKPLKAQTEPKQILRLACPSADEASCVFAAQFINVFKDAGFDVEAGIVQRVTLAIPFDGIRMFEHTDRRANPASDPPNAGSWTAITPTQINVYKAFSKLGIEVDTGSDSDLPGGIMTIYFGPPRTNESAPTAFTETMKRISAFKPPKPPRASH